MRTWRLSLIILAVAAASACNDSKPSDETKPVEKPPAVTAPPATELISLAWKPANADQNLQAIELRLTGADVVSVCRTPPGWILKGTGAEIRGYATVGAGFISVDDLQDLDALFLIRPHAGQTLGVSGKLLTGAYTGDEGQSEVVATSALLRRDPAKQCPSPRR